MTELRKKKDPNDQAPETALRLLARREHSRLELDLKLRQRGVDRNVIDSVLDDFEERGWLSDERFAEVFVRQRMDAGYGPMRILADLQQRGIRNTPPELAAVPEQTWLNTAISLRERKFGLGDVFRDWPERQRQGSFLARRGYTAEQIEAALDTVRPSGTGPLA